MIIRHTKLFKYLTLTLSYKERKLFLFIYRLLYGKIASFHSVCIFVCKILSCNSFRSLLSHTSLPSLQPLKTKYEFSSTPREKSRLENSSQLEQSQITLCFNLLLFSLIRTCSLRSASFYGIFAKKSSFFKER